MSLNSLKSMVQELSHSIEERFWNIRCQIHSNPELSFQEHETSQLVCDQLDEMGIPYERGIAGTGVVGIIEGASEGRVIALRGDMDALPITEANEDKDYRSKNDGVMHACGHDVHTTALLGAAFILNKTRDRWTGTVKLLFQPGEEKLPGGASMMIAEGVLESPKPEFIIGHHVHPPMVSGRFGYKPGQYMASADEIYLRIVGKGGHAALPQDFIDPITISASVLNALQQVNSRKCKPGVPSVLSFGKIYSEGGATNVIPDAVRIEGTFRTMDESWRNEALDWVHRIAKSQAESLGGHCEVEIKRGYPSLINDHALAEKAGDWMKELVGEDNVTVLPIRMTAEDFSYYTQEMPGFSIALGWQIQRLVRVRRCILPASISTGLP